MPHDNSSSRTLSRQEAVDFLLAEARPLTATEEVPVEQALGRVLAAGLRSSIDVPGWDNSAMDGYALRHADLAAHQGELAVSQRIAAGSAPEPLVPGTAARIFTGAPVPAGADTVVIQEVCERMDDRVRIPLDSKAGANIRRAGEDVRAGARVLEPGIRLAAGHLGLAAAVGASGLTVYRRLRVAVCSTGDELVDAGQPLGPGQIHDSNRVLLRGLLQSLGCEVVDGGRIPDDLEATVARLDELAGQVDLVLASGGVSVGEEDHVKAAVARLGSIGMHRVAIRPGKPVVFGWLGQTPFLGTPGNPVSLFVSVLLFARPLILRMQGRTGNLQPRVLRLPAAFDWPKPDAKRVEFHRARLEPGADGTLEVEVFANRSSAAVSSVAWAGGLVELAPGERIRRGEPVSFLPFSDLLW